ncbi:MAG: hypothetical protein AB1779_01920 [Candidatus Thermoplasmatota archaeon]
MAIPPPYQPIQKIDVSVRYPEITVGKIIGMLLMIVVVVLNIIFNLDSQHIIFVGIFSGIGLVFGIIAIFKIGGEKLQPYFICLSPIFIVMGAAFKAPGMYIGTITFFNLGTSLIFAILFLMYIEYLHGIRRFTEIGEMAIERDLRDFDFKRVFYRYIGFGFVIFGIIAVILFIICIIHTTFVTTLPGQIGRSIELNSVFGLAIISIIVFGLLGTILTVIFGGKEYVRTIKAVTAISKKKLEEIAERTRAAPPQLDIYGRPIKPR